MRPTSRFGRVAGATAPDTRRAPSTSMWRSRIKSANSSPETVRPSSGRYRANHSEAMLSRTARFARRIFLARRTASGSSSGSPMSAASSASTTHEERRSSASKSHSSASSSSSYMTSATGPPQMVVSFASGPSSGRYIPLVYASASFTSLAGKWMWSTSAPTAQSHVACASSCAISLNIPSGRTNRGDTISVTVDTNASTLLVSYVGSSSQSGSSSSVFMAPPRDALLFCCGWIIVRP